MSPHAPTPQQTDRMTSHRGHPIACDWLRRTVVRLLPILLPLLLLALAGCASLPDVNRQAIASEGIAASPQTNLGRIASAYRPDALHSGWRLMPLGSYSLDTRVELARRASSTRVSSE